jgi:hypothetical protein
MRLHTNDIKPVTVLAILFSLLCCRTIGQEQFIAPPSRLLTRFSFKMLTGGIVIIQGTVDQYPDTLNFVFDTGSGGISLDSLTVTYLKIKTTPSPRTIKGIAGMRKVDFAYNHTLCLPGLTVDNLDFHINNYDLLSSVYGVKIDGIVGYSFLRRYIVGINYDTHEMEVYTPGTFSYPKGGHFLRPNFSTLPMQLATVKDARSVLARYYMDTGAGLCMLFSRDFLQDSGLLLKKRKPLATQAEGIGGKKSMEVTVIKEVRVGPYKFRKVPVYIFDDEFKVTSYPVLGGLLGNDIMRRFNAVFNYAEQVVHIKPNMAYTEVFDYSYTGLGMYLVDEAIRIVDVIRDSPADKAGFLPDDIIVSIGNSISKDIQVYKTMLQHANTTCRVVVSRNGELVVLKLRIKSILRN